MSSPGSACDTACSQTGGERRESRALPGSIQKPGEFLTCHQAPVTVLLPSVHISISKSVWLQICTELSSLATYSGSDISTEILAVRKERNTHFTILVNLLFPYTVEKKNSGETLFITFLISFKVWQITITISLSTVSLSLSEEAQVYLVLRSICIAGRRKNQTRTIKITFSF